VTSNGDQNPYGVAFVPEGIRNGGMLQAGDLLVSNFNNNGPNGGTQGTGSTIQLLTPDGQHQTFFNGSTVLPGEALGLTTALGVLKSGFVIVGNVPTDTNGVAQQGSLIILDGNGKVVEQLTNAKLLDGPWDLAINDHGFFAQVFVSNVLSGTVTRIDLLTLPGQTPKVLDMTQIASGFAHHTDPNALVVGPTGLAFDQRTGTLFVASTADNGIFAIHNAAHTFRDHGTGEVVVQNDPHLHGPLGLVLAPNGDLIVANGDAPTVSPGGTANDLVEFDRFGDFVGDFQIDKGNPGAAFGIALTTDGGQLRFAAVDDNTNTVQVFTLPLRGDQDGDDFFFHHHHHHHFGDFA
jgi:DNA-binding beta-propeller fold protein YncE